MDHPFLATIDFIALERKDIEPPVKPIIEHPTDDANFEQVRRTPPRSPCHRRPSHPLPRLTPHFASTASHPAPAQDYFDGKPAMQVEHWTGVLARYKEQAEVAFRDF